MKRLAPARRSIFRSCLILLSFLIISGASNAQMSLLSPNVNFGNVRMGSSSIAPVSISNTGKSSLTISQATVFGTGFSFAGPDLPITIAPQQSASLSVTFSPSAAGTVSGTLTVATSASWGGRNKQHTSTSTVALSGTGYTVASPGYLNAPSSMNLGSALIGTSQTQVLKLSNSGGSTLNILSAGVSSTGFSVSGLTFPYPLVAGASANFSVTFTPNSVGTATATLAVTSDASDPSISVALSGTATTTTGTLAVTPISMSFGAIMVGTSQSQTGNITASGGSVTLSSASSNNSQFTLSGLTLPVTIAAGQTLPYTVTFAPTATGSVSANIAFVTTNSSSASEIASGSGATIQHSVDLSWNASTSTSVTGYNVYRATLPGGAYTRVNSSLNTSMNYSDSTVRSGQTYYYVTTAVESNGMESSYSNQVQAAVPTP